ncbi:MAG: metalloregulator ArsR/SmtB family transcription factor [Parvularculaceae bacterium]
MEAVLDRTMIALSDPTRRAIIAMLEKGEARVTEIAEPFDMSLNAVSKHIKLLERAELLTRRKAGREHFLSFNPAPLDALSRWVEAKRAFWSARLDALEAAINDEIENEKGDTK